MWNTAKFLKSFENEVVGKWQEFLSEIRLNMRISFVFAETTSSKLSSPLVAACSKTFPTNSKIVEIFCPRWRLFQETLSNNKKLLDVASVETRLQGPAIVENCWWKFGILQEKNMVSNEVAFKNLATSDFLNTTIFRNSFQSKFLRSRWELSFEI